MIKYSNLGDYQLLMIAQECGIRDNRLNEEWKKRFAMNFPYKLTAQRKIYNCLLDSIVSDEEADKLILEQAIQIRKQLNSLTFNAKSKSI